MSVNVGDLEGVLSRYGLILERWGESGSKLEGWNIDYGDEVRLVEEIHTEVLALQGDGALELV